MKFFEDAPLETIIAEKKLRVRESQTEYFEFWRTNVAPRYLEKWAGKEVESPNGGES